MNKVVSWVRFEFAAPLSFAYLCFLFEGLGSDWLVPVGVLVLQHRQAAFSRYVALGRPGTCGTESIS